MLLIPKKIISIIVMAPLTLFAIILGSSVDLSNKFYFFFKDRIHNPAQNFFDVFGEFK